MTFAQLKALLQVNLNESGLVYVTDADLNYSLQDGYDDICARTKCIVKKTTVNFVANLTYYDLVDLGVTDFLGAIAIYNNNTNRWLEDNITLRQFRQMRDDWELWAGTPAYWAPASHDKIAIVPRYTTATGNFDLYYYGTAPTISDGSTILVHEPKLLELYCTADLLEAQEEFSKASFFWEEYERKVTDYADRVTSLAKSDLLQVI